MSRAVSKAGYWKVKDHPVVLLEALVPADPAVKQLFIQGEGGNGRQQPAVTCTMSWGTHTGQARPAGSLLPLTLTGPFNPESHDSLLGQIVWDSFPPVSEGPAASLEVLSSSLPPTCHMLTIPHVLSSQWSRKCKERKEEAKIILFDSLITTLRKHLVGGNTEAIWPAQDACVCVCVPCSA